jgi:hypothetical protein
MPIHKSKRPKFKVGDIIEEWYKNEWTTTHLVVKVQIEWTEAARMQNKALCKRICWWYTFLNLETGDVEDLYTKGIDRPSQYLSQNSSEWIGYRKIG